MTISSVCGLRRMRRLTECRGLLAYLDDVGDWEQHRRRGVDFELQRPMAAIDDSEIEAALAALRVLSARFRSSRHDAAALLFDAIADAIRPAQVGHSLH